ncbi:S1 family peptidase [Streptosporangium sp. NBC_01756]|uniref:S1 family peptidase n=1 Tax=Streptosporangium sp. NBC_01756 TaxID=2975950 RepID=UPI002DDB16B6|nr:S1 family peptidase [Streptosporangium sp. NBC_01756]WSC89787.1 S1 family peptidase [Streptosporangium sp. NBC_01756]
MPRRHAVATGCVLAITALVSTAVPAVAQPLKAAVAAAPAALKPPPGMLEALQRDLHLTREQAQTRLLNETRLTGVEAQLRERLGARFGGSWFVGTLAQTLVVTSTDPADLPQIIAAGARGEVVSRSLTQLEQARDIIDASVSTTGGKVRYVDVKNNRVVVLTSDALATEDLIEASGVSTTIVQAVQSTESPRLLKDVVGGDAYYIGTTSRCSVGFSVTKGTQNGFVTAGHCGMAGRTTAGPNRAPQGVFQTSTFPVSDFAWVAVNSGWTPKPAVDNGTGGTVNVAGSRAAIEGASVCRSGSTTGWHCGLVLQRGASVIYAQGTISELVRTNVCAEAGDSGGSFISVDQAQGVTSGGSGDCNVGGVTYFQPIGEILTAYGLTLMTVGDPPGTTTCTDYPKTVTGALTSGQSVNQPNRYYITTARGFHSACLDANDTVDFDLYLQKWNNRSWVTVATADGPAPDEKIGYTGAAGYYRYQVVASSGSGSYTLKYKTP